MTINIPLDPVDGDNVIKLSAPFKKPVPEGQFLMVGPMPCCHFNGPFIVDDTLAEVTCGKCQAKLNPMFVLKQLAHQETRWHESMRRYQGEMKRLDERSSTKCQHCKKLTRISKS